MDRPLTRLVDCAPMPAAFAIYPSLQGASVIVTGGASGIGAEIVRAFAAQGSRVGFVDFDVERGTALASELRDAAGQVRFERCDLRDVDDLRRAFSTLATVQGPARVLVNNAARDDRHAWQDVTPEFYDERIATNLRHMFFAIQAVAPAMIAAMITKNRWDPPVAAAPNSLASNGWLARLSGLSAMRSRG